MDKLKYIDALRGIAVLAVIVSHVGAESTMNLSPTVASLVREGARGVQLFFLLSALTLFLSFKNRFSKEQFPIRNFFIRRFFRIAPMYYVAICYYTLQSGLEAIAAPNVVASYIGSHVLFLHGFSPYWISSVVPGGWSVGIEMMFYVILPLLFFRIKTLNQAFNFLLLSWVFSVLFHAILENGYTRGTKSVLWHDYLFICLPNQLPVFALGIVLYFIIFESESKNKIAPISILLLVGLVFAAQIGLRIPILEALMLPNHFVFGLSFFILVIGVSKMQISILVNTLTIYIGKISFSMYLVHLGILHLFAINNFGNYTTYSFLNLVIKSIIVISVSAIFSTIFYRIIETPFQNLGKKLITKLEKNHIKP